MISDNSNLTNQSNSCSVAARAAFADLDGIINISKVAAKYFNRSHAWLSQKIYGHTVLGKPKTLSPAECRQLAAAFLSIAKRLGIHASNIANAPMDAPDEPDEFPSFEKFIDTDYINSQLISDKDGAIRFTFHDLDGMLSMARIAKRYFHKSHAWFSHKLHGAVLDGRTQTFSEPEADTLAAALRHIAGCLTTHAANLDAAAGTEEKQP